MDTPMMEVSVRIDRVAEVVTDLEREDDVLVGCSASNSTRMVRSSPVRM